MFRLSSFLVGAAMSLMLGTLAMAQPAQAETKAETKSFYSPIIFVDKEKGYIVISNSGAVFGIEVPPEAKPHLEKLPLSGLIDVVVEMRPDQAPLVKRWKIASGETTCRVFDGRECH